MFAANYLCQYIGSTKLSDIPTLSNGRLILESPLKLCFYPMRTRKLNLRCNSACGARGCWVVRQWNDWSLAISLKNYTRVGPRQYTLESSVPSRGMSRRESLFLMKDSPSVGERS